MMIFLFLFKIMSRKSYDINATIIKLEDEPDEFYSTGMPHLNTSSSTVYKGKIEVTSKGRRKIFDGVRWQILCRRPGLSINHFRSVNHSICLSLKIVESKPIRNLFVSHITKKNMAMVFLFILQ